VHQLPAQIGDANGDGMAAMSKPRKGTPRLDQEAIDWAVTEQAASEAAWDPPLE